jgi:hypothetical protein
MECIGKQLPAASRLLGSVNGISVVGGVTRVSGMSEKRPQILPLRIAHGQDGSEGRVFDQEVKKDSTSAMFWVMR